MTGAKFTTRPIALLRPSRWTVRRWLNTAWRLVVFIVLLSVSAVMLVPFFWMLSTSLKPDDQIFAFPPVWIPRELRWSNYVEAWNYAPFDIYLRNTVVVTVSSTVAALISSSVVAFGFARLEFPGKNLLFGMLLSTMMIPYFVTLIPVFIIFHTIGWVDTLLPLIVPAWFGPPFYVFLVRQFFLSLPRELEDAARIDGCSTLRILFSIFLPLSKPALTSVAVFSFQSNWGAFIEPLVYLNSMNKRTLAVGLYSFLGEHTAEWGYLMAASVLMLVPVIVLFFSAQNYFMQGIVTTGFGGR